MDKFNECFNSDYAEAYIKNEDFKAVQLGIPGTPAFFVNNRPIPNTSLRDIEQAIEEALASAGAQ